MKTHFWLILCCLPPFVSCTRVNPEEVSRPDSGKTNMSSPAWPFFAFCMDTHDAKKRTLAQQATMLRDLRYAGCGHLWLDDVETRTKTLSNVGLRLFQVYVNVDLAKPQPLDEKRITKILPLLKPHRTQLVLLMTGGEPSDSKLDEQAVGVVKHLADMARPHEVTIVLYPHVNFWLATCGDAVRVVKKVNRRAEVGVMFNLCHWMKGDPNRNLRAVIKEAMPWLMAVSLSGSDMPEQVRRGKGNWIQPLDQGTYDLRDLLGILRDNGFSGPIGLQCWGIAGDARTHLKRSIAAWKRVMMNQEASKKSMSIGKQWPPD